MTGWDDEGNFSSSAEVREFLDNSPDKDEFSQRPWRIGWQFVHLRPFLTQAHLAHFPMPQHEQQGGGILRKGEVVCVSREKLDRSKVA